VARFSEFLGKCEYAKNIVWLTPEDVLLSGKRFVYVKCPVPENNEAKARKIYSEGMAHGRGLLMATVCEMDDSTCCYIWYPKSKEEEPQGIWPHDGSVKMSASQDRIPGKPVRSQLRWKFLVWRYQSKQHLKPFLLR